MFSILGYSPVFLGVAALAGLMMALQGSINSVLGEKIGIWETNFFVHLLAALVLMLILFINRRDNIELDLWRNIPWYLYLGGLIAILITYGVVVSIPKLGVAVATTAIITGQVLTAALIDHFGVFGLEKVAFSWWRLLGITLLGAGVRLLLH